MLSFVNGVFVGGYKSRNFRVLEVVLPVVVGALGRASEESPDEDVWMACSIRVVTWSRHVSKAFRVFCFRAFISLVERSFSWSAFSFFCFASLSGSAFGSECWSFSSSVMFEMSRDLSRLADALKLSRMS